MRGGEMELPRVRTRRSPSRPRESGPGRVAVWGLDGSAGEAGGGEEEEEEGETAAHAHSARLAASLLFSRPSPREPRREARARRPCSSSMAIF